MSRGEIYDPDDEPGPAWLELEEDDRRERVRAAHERTAAPAGERPELHMIIHVIIENRLAAGDAPVRDAYDRLRAAGLDRHTTVHALGSVITTQIYQVMNDEEALDQETMDRAYADIDPADWRAAPPRQEHVVRAALGRRKKKPKKR